MYESTRTETPESRSILCLAHQNDQPSPDLTVETDQGQISPARAGLATAGRSCFRTPRISPPFVTHRIPAPSCPTCREWKNVAPKVDGISVDGVEEHKKCESRSSTFAVPKAGFPIIAEQRSDRGPSVRTWAGPPTLYLPDRPHPNVAPQSAPMFIIACDRQLKLSMNLSHDRGRNFAECCVRWTGATSDRQGRWQHRRTGTVATM